MVQRAGLDACSNQGHDWAVAVSAHLCLQTVKLLKQQQDNITECAAAQCGALHRDMNLAAAGLGGGSTTLCSRCCYTHQNVYS